MRTFLRIICAVVAIALIAYGILQPVEQDTTWIRSLWLAAPLMLIAARLSVPTLPRGFSRSIRNLGIVICLGFGMLSLQLLRQQFVQADSIYNYIYLDEQTGQSTSNIRPVVQAERIHRGKIYDRNGELLVDTQITQNGYAVRTYPLTNQYSPQAFGSVLGYFSNRFGYTGLERTYNDYLTGERNPLRTAQNALTGNPQVGDDLHLTIDARLQDAAARILGNRTGSIVVLNPKTGAVLAMASTPGFDPSQLAANRGAEDQDADNQRVDQYWQSLNSDTAGQPLLNRPTQGRYPPGSTFKTVTAISALENPQQGQPDNIDCPNQRPTIEGAPPVVNAVQDLSRFTGDPSSLERVYAYSCNTAFAQYALRLGPDRLADTSAAFDIFRAEDAPRIYDGFTDLPTEPSLLYTTPGFLNTLPALADTGYGQGEMFVTPLQMAMVAAAVANNGNMLQPYLVDRITDPDGNLVTAHGSRLLKRSMSADIAARMRANMRAGVEYGFGKAAQQVDPSVALVGGKSGTAEHGPGTTPHAWFIAIAPVQDPRYAVAVMIENGADGAGLGAQLAGEVIASAFGLER